MSCGFNRQDSACGLWGNNGCWESGFVPVPLPINRPQYMYETVCDEGSTTYYGTGKPCCSAPKCGSGNCGTVSSCGSCNSKGDAYREGYKPCSAANSKWRPPVEENAAERKSIGYGRIKEPAMCCGKSPKRINCCVRGKCGLDCRNKGGNCLVGNDSSRSACNFCSYY